MAIDRTGRVVTLDRTPTVSGGSSSTGSPAFLTDFVADAYAGANFRYAYAAGAAAQINVSFPVADIARIIVVVRGAHPRGPPPPGRRTPRGAPWSCSTRVP